MRETEDRLCQTVRDCFAYILIMIPLNKLMILTRFNLRDSTRDGKVREYEVPSVGSYECYELVLDYARNRTRSRRNVFTCHDDMRDT